MENWKLEDLNCADEWKWSGDVGALYTALTRGSEVEEQESDRGDHGIGPLIFESGSHSECSSVLPAAAKSSRLAVV